MGENQNNPLLQRFNTIYGTAPFHLIKNEHFLPAFKFAIKEGDKEIQNITNDIAQPDFENTIKSLEKTGRLLDRISGVF